MTVAGPPKSRNAAETRARILDAASHTFAERGFSNAGIRDIAAVAGITSPLLLRYFGSKAGLFRAALERTTTVDVLLTHPRDQFGRILIETIVKSENAALSPSMVALSVGDPVAREIASEVIETLVIKPLRDWLGEPESDARARQIVLLAMGFVMLARDSFLTGADGGAALKRRYAQSLQDIVDVRS